MVVASDEGVRVHLLKKFARMLDGIDLSNHEVGDIMDLPDPKARLLIAEGWAVKERRIAGQSNVIAFRRASDVGAMREEDRISRAS